MLTIKELKRILKVQKKCIDEETKDITDKALISAIENLLYLIDYYDEIYKRKEEQKK